MGGCCSSNHGFNKEETLCLIQNGLQSDNEKEPWCLRPDELPSWYRDNIQSGSKLFGKECREAVDQVVTWMHQKCAYSGELFHLSKIIKGGSLGKGTMLKDKSDVDLVAFIKAPHLSRIGSSTPECYRRQLKDVINKLETALRKSRNVKIIRSDEYLVNFAIDVGSRRIQVDLLPTADNVHGRNLDEVFNEMLRTTPYDMGYYSASLVKLQRDFVKSQPNHVKELIRLVKYWAYTILPEQLHKSYPLELITIYCWEMAGSPHGFNKAQGLKDVLQVLTNLSSLRHYWEEYYGRNLAEKSIKKLSHTRPIMLDPANPTNNVCWVYQEGNNMNVMAHAAQSTLDSTLLRGVTVYSDWSGYYNDYY